MLIVDSQVHIWGANTPQRPWPAAGEAGRTAEPQRAEPWTAEEVLAKMEAAGIARAVIVPPSWEGERNDLALAAAARYPGRFAVMGRLDLTRPANRELVPGWRSTPGMLGIRLILRGAEAWLKEGADHWLWGAAERAGVPITLVPLHWYPLLDEILTRHPALRLSIDHLGCATHEKDAAAFAHLPQLLRLARFPNVAVKSSCLPAYTNAAYPFPAVHEPLRRVFDAFGPKRMFWGSDISRLPCPYRELIALFTEELPWLAGDDLEWVMGRGVCEWFGWKL